MLSARNRSAFTETQWQELEHQALVFKYMLSGAPIPPDLIYNVKRSLDSSMASRLYSHQTGGWGCFQVGFGRKADPEPGRCRRTDGKKWRCSKEAYPDSKYCERHMHRGKNRSRKPVEIVTTAPTSSPAMKTQPISPFFITPSSPTNPTPPPSSFSLHSFPSTLPSEPQSQPHHYHYPTNSNSSAYTFPYQHSSSSSTSRPPPAPQNNHTHHLFLDSGPYSSLNQGCRYIHGMKESGDERSFFPEASGSLRSLPESYTPFNSSSYPHFEGVAESSKQQQTHQGDQEQKHCFVLGNDFKSVRSVNLETHNEDETQKPLHHFFSEWPQKSRDSWLDLEDDHPSTHASFSTTQLSISLPMSSHHELFASNSRTRTDG